MTHSWGFAPRSACGTRPARTIPDSIVLLSGCTITNTLPEINPASGILTLSAAPPVKTVRRRLGCRDENVMGILQEEHTQPLSGEGTAEDAARRIQIDDRLSLIGSFNWDMRSAYLDTELMLLVDCPALNAALREQTEEMMRQSRLVSPDGTETAGAAYIAPERSPLKAALQAVIRCLIRLFRFVL